MSMIENVLKSMTATELLDWHDNVKIDGAASRRIVAELTNRTNLTLRERLRLATLIDPAACEYLQGMSNDA